METKACTKCKKIFPHTADYFHKSGKGYLKARCKTCTNEDSRKSYTIYRDKANRAYDEITENKRGLDTANLDLALVKGAKYKVKHRVGHSGYGKYNIYTGVLELVTKDLIGLRHKAGYMETFMIKDLLLREVEVERI